MYRIIAVQACEKSSMEICSETEKMMSGPMKQQLTCPGRRLSTVYGKWQRCSADSKQKTKTKELGADFARDVF